MEKSSPPKRHAATVPISLIPSKMMPRKIVSSKIAGRIATTRRTPKSPPPLREGSETSAHAAHFFEGERKELFIQLNPNSSRTQNDAMI